MTRAQTCFFRYAFATEEEAAASKRLAFCFIFDASVFRKVRSILQADANRASVFQYPKKKKTWNSVFQKVMYRFYRQAKMKRSSLKCRQNNNYMEHSFRESYQSILQTDVNSSLSVSIEKNGTQFSRKSWIDLTGWFESCLSFSVSKTKTSKETLHLLLFPFWKRYNLLYEWWKILISRYIWGPKTVSSLRDFRSTISFHSQNRELLAKSLSAYNQITSISREC